MSRIAGYEAGRAVAALSIAEGPRHSTPGALVNAGRAVLACLDETRMMAAIGGIRKRNEDRG